MSVTRRLSLDKDVLSELESDELAQLAAGAGADTIVTCRCPQATGSSCVVYCNTVHLCSYNACVTIPVADCVTRAG